MRVPKSLNNILSFGRRIGLHQDWYLIVVAAGIGTVTAFGAIAFMTLMEGTERRVAELSGVIPWWTLPVLPMGGALVSGLIVYLFAREARGQGVLEVMDSLYRKGAVIRPRIATVKSIASICTIGSGGSAGVEGPIVHIGSAIGSGLAQLLRVPRDHAATLLGCGAAAGIASVFNAPIAGVMFALEILLRDFSLRTFTPIVVASVFSTATTQAWYGENDAIFAAPRRMAEYQFTITELPSYLLLGLVCGGLAVLFTRTLYGTEDLYDKLKLHPIIKPVTGALALGVLGIAYLQFAGGGGGQGTLPAFFGNGYETIRGLLSPGSYGVEFDDVAAVTGANVPVVIGEVSGIIEPVQRSLLFLGLLIVLKLIATAFTLGSGGSGGVSAPSLFLGASAGAFFGVLLDHVGLLPDGGSPAAYALVGMAATLAGSTHAPLTAILILFELTRDVYVLLPVMLASVVATIFAQLLMRDSIYSLKLRRRGVLIGIAADLTILRRLTVGDVTSHPASKVGPDEPLSALFERRDGEHAIDFVVTDHNGEYLGMVTAQEMRTALIEREAIPYLVVSEVMRRDLPTVSPDETLDRVLEKFSKHDVASLALVDDSTKARQVLGLITRGRLMQRYQRALTESA